MSNYNRQKLLVSFERIMDDNTRCILKDVFENAIQELGDSVKEFSKSINNNIYDSIIEVIEEDGKEKNNDN